MLKTRVNYETPTPKAKFPTIKVFGDYHEIDAHRFHLKDSFEDCFEAEQVGTVSSGYLGLFYLDTQARPSQEEMVQILRDLGYSDKFVESVLWR